ncbi:MAG: choice-of-anchor I family protein, partial [Actinomycetota bacterium]
RITARRAGAIAGAVLAAGGAAALAATDGGRGRADAHAARAGARDPVLTPIGAYATGLGDLSAETADLEAGRLFVTNTETNSLDIVDVRDPAAPARIARIDLSPYGAGPNSVDAHGGLVAIAVEAAAKTDPGSVVLLRRDGSLAARATVGALPDMLAFTPDGTRIVVANEGEPSSYGQADSVDPEGSVSVIRVAKLLAGRPGAVRTIRFTDFDAGGPRHDELPAGIRLNGPGATVAQDLEPEYVAFDPADPGTAVVTLQEANAAAVVDIDGARVERIVALGTKDHGAAGNGLDASDRDNLVNIRPWPVKGMPMPDAVASFRAGGRTYYVTANEGDGRDYTGFSDEASAGSLTLDPAAFPDAAELKKSANLGRLTVSRTDGASPTGHTELRAFGTRSASIWDDEGTLVSDTGDMFEQVTAKAQPAAFNANNTSAAFDNRSDNKGPEPEGVATGVVRGRTYAFVGLERVGGLVVLDVTDPAAPRFVQWANTRDYGQAAGPDSGPEIVKFVPAAASPTRRPLVLAANEVSGTVNIYEARPRSEATTLTLLHNNDGESSLLPIQYPTAAGSLDVGGAAAFTTVGNREITRARGLGNSVLNVYAGDALLASSTLACSLPPAPASTPVYDAVAQRQMAYDAHVVGNHELDFGPSFLARFVRDFTRGGVLDQPFLSGNLDFTGEPDFADLIDPDGLIVGTSRDGRVVSRSLIHVDPATGQRFGVVAATTWTLPTISSPGNIRVTSTDLDTTATVVQREVDRLHRMGIRKIVLVSHLQDLTNDLQLLPRLHRVDVAVGGGGDEYLGTDAEKLPGEQQAAFGAYPATAVDADGRAVPVVTTAGNYKYLGRLEVRFDAAGEVAEVVAGSGPKRVIPATQPTAGILAALGVTDQAAGNAGVNATVTAPLQACLAAFSQPLVGTEVALDTSRAGNRGRETNTGNTITDAFLAAYDRQAAGLGLPPRGGAAKVIAVQNGGGIRQNAGDVLPAGGAVPGALSRRNTLDVLAFFTNAMTVVRDVSPQDLKDVFERSASTLGGGQFLQVAGLDVTIEVTGRTAQAIAADGTVTTPGTRVRAITLDDGTPIVADGAVVPGAPAVSIVTNSFTAAGGDNYPWLRDAPGKVNLAGTYEQAWVEYLTSLPAQTVGGASLPTIPDENPDYATASPGSRIHILP